VAYAEWLLRTELGVVLNKLKLPLIELYKIRYD
jgi:hypothetical protein